MPRTLVLLQAQQQYWHVPALQVPPGPQAWPQVPQLFTSVCVFTQVPLQLVWPDGQVVAHVPF
jgi:hypothetical protein